MVRTIRKPNKMPAILFFYHSKSEHKKVRISNGFGIRMFGIRALTVSDNLVFSDHVKSHMISSTYGIQAYPHASAASREVANLT